jgi:hypothetical protein
VAGPLATLRIILGLDAREVEEGVGKANKAATGFGTGAKVAFGVAAGAATIGFGLMAKGAAEMERSQGAFQAATGKSREEAVEFSKGMNSLVGTAATVGKSFDEISKAGITVAQQFGVTGEEATQLTADVLAFAKVTGQDAPGAAAALEDALSAFGLSAEDAAGMMDVLVASNQKFGTDVGPTTLDQLKKMAPALQAMGVEADEAVGFLNMFEAAGLDAAGAMKGFNSAINNIPPGESMQSVLEKIQAIEDPLERAQYAAEIFGAKAGSGLANALKPGGLALEDYIITVDEAEGASDDAAEAMLTTGDRIRMFGEKGIAALRGLGQEFGPLASGLGGLVSLTATLAPAFGKGLAPLKDMIKGLIPKLLPAAIFTGTATGGAQGEAQALAATGPGVVSSMFTRIAALAIPLAPAGTTVGTAIGAAMAVAIPLGLIAGAATLAAAVTVAIMTPIRDSGVVNDFWDTIFGEGADLRAKVAAYTANVDRMVADGLTFEEAKAQATQRLVDLFGQPMADTVEAAAYGTGAAAAHTVGVAFSETVVGVDFATRLRGTGQRVVDYVGEGVGQGTEQLTGYMSTLVGRAAVAAKVDTAEELGVRTTAALGRGMSSAEATQGMFGELDQLKQAIENHLSPREQALKIIGGNYVETLAEGMRHADPDIRLASVGLTLSAINTLEDGGLQGPKGKKSMRQMGILYTELLATGMTAAEARAELAAQGVSEATIDELEAGKGPAGTAGRDTTAAYAGGIVGHGGGRTGGIGAQLSGGAKGPAGSAAASVRTGAVNVLSNTSGFQGYGAATTGEYADGIEAGGRIAIARARAIAATIRAILKANSPPDNPLLRDIGKWGQNTIEEYATGLARGGAAVDEAMAGIVGSVAGISPTMPSGFGAAAYGGGGGVVIEGGIHVTVNGADDPAGTGVAVRNGITAALDDVIRKARGSSTLRWSPSG